MNWKSINLHGAAGISRVVSMYEVQDLRGVPWTKYKIKVLERSEGFIALPNVAVRSAGGSVDWLSGLGGTEIEALEDLISRFGEILSSRKVWQPEDFEWSEPNDF